MSATTAAPAPAARRGRVLEVVRPALGPWVAVHLLALSALAAVALVEAGQLPWSGDAPGARGWWAWDAGWYRSIAANGYVAETGTDFRFFPLFPLLGRLLGVLPGVSAGAGLVVVASAAALAYLAALVRLTETLTGSPDTARRTAWLAALFPGAAVLALPYTEALAGLLAVLFFLGLQRRSLALVAVAGALSGAARPTGLLLVGAAAVFLLTDRTRRPAALVGVVAPVLGTASFGVWSLLAFGDPLVPWTVQSNEGLRGGVLVNPVPGILDDPSGGLPPVVTLMFVLAGVALLVLAVRRLPLPYLAWSGVMLVLAVSSIHAHSLPRYLAGIFPLLIAGAAAAPSGRAWRLLLVALAVASVALTASWFADLVVP